MNIPLFWAEARLQDKVNDRRVTLCRFGWSDVSQEEAQKNADDRAKAAYSQLLSGINIKRREKKSSYNGADGVPIREEIVNRHQDVIVTRNRYGALCINTPNVLFADIDTERELTLRSVLLLLLGSIVVVFFLAQAILRSYIHVWRNSILWNTLLLALIIGVLLGGYLMTKYVIIMKVIRGNTDKWIRNKIKTFVGQHTDWHLRLYRTPAGYRVLGMHKTFSPNEPEVADFYRTLACDPVFTRMCINQKCFRARVSPKPWRMGIREHMPPRTGYWPINPDKFPMRNQWIAMYEQKSSDYASCRFMESFGSKTTDPSALAVQVLHDTLCQSDSLLPLA